MKNELKFAVLGGDLRQLVTAKEFAADGYEVALFGFNEYQGDFGEVTRCDDISSALGNADIIILPLPCSFDGIHLNAPFSKSEVKISRIFEIAGPEALFLGGKICPKIQDYAEKNSIDMIDYFKREELIVSNSIPSAEGAVAIALNELPITLFASHSLVLGFGRLGKILSKTLAALGSDVHVAARRTSDFAWMEAYGYTPHNIYKLTEEVRNADVIFNTVPQIILNEELLHEIPEKTLIVDLASRPGGVDMEAAKKLGIRVVWALSLPGKVAPVSAGHIIKTTVLHILEERGMLTT